MKLDMTVEFEDGEKLDVRVGPVSQVAFEREHNVGIGVIASEQKMSHIYWLAWHANTKGRKSFDEWLEGVAAIEVHAEEADPFERDPSEGS